MLVYSHALLFNNVKAAISASSASLKETITWLTSLRESHAETTQTQAQSTPTPPQKSVIKIDWLPLLENVRAPRWPIVLCHGLFGFDKMGPANYPRLQIHYWAGIQQALAKLGAKVIVTKVPSTGTIQSRAQVLHETLERASPNGKVNLLAHSMGGLDCRYLISHHRDRTYQPLSLTTLSTPHRGSPFMDWCRDYMGLGALKDEHKLDVKPTQRPKVPEEYDIDYQVYSAYMAEREGEKVPSSLSKKNPEKQQQSEIKASQSSPTSSSPLSTNNLLSTAANAASALLDKIPAPSSAFTSSVISNVANVADTPAYANLTTDFLRDFFNPSTPDDPRVRYYSIGGQIDSPPPILSPLYVPFSVVKAVEGPNDGLVSVDSAKWGEYLGTVPVDHWDMRGGQRLIGGRSKNDWNAEEFYVRLATFLWQEGL